MVLTCEVCGNPIRNGPNRIKIDGAVLQVCQNCAGHGTPLGPPAPRSRPARIRSLANEALTEPEVEVDPDYNLIVKRAREKMGLTQEALGRAINVKPSVISHVESKKMKPDLILARTLMHHLKVNLLVPSSELEGSSSGGDTSSNWS
jgi:putative transcription factor